MCPRRPATASRMPTAAASARFQGPEQNGRVEVALHPAARAERLPAAVDGHPPVEADHVAAHRLHLAEQVRRPGPEVDRRHVDRLEHARRVGRDELAVVGDRERAGPGVEELDRIGAGLDARAHVERERVGELLHQRVPDLRLPVHARLRLHEVARRLALDQVAGDRERAAGEADHRLVGRSSSRTRRTASSMNGTDSSGLGHDQALDVGERLDRLGDDRPDVLDQLHVDAHPEDGQHDVGEHHRRVDAVAHAPAAASPPRRAPAGGRPRTGCTASGARGTRAASAPPGA